jgi:hypothetical protein
MNLQLIHPLNERKTKKKQKKPQQILNILFSLLKRIELYAVVNMRAKRALYG